MGKTPMFTAHNPRRLRAWLPLLLALLIFCSLAAYQLDLPGLHYDEAKEAGLNAMQLVRGQPVTLFRNAGLHLFGLTLPTMVQDYIGALNVYLALPFLALGGAGVFALRGLPIACAGLTLIFLYLFAAAAFNRRTAGLAVLLLAVNPSFVFWSRQGILVTNVTVTLFCASLWTAWRWQQTRQARWLWLTGFLWGLGLWAKLLFIWAIGAMLVIAALGWLRRGAFRPWGVAHEGGLRSRYSDVSRRTAVRQWVGFGLAFLAGVWPLLHFNLQTGGTVASIVGNLNTSYYGVSNTHFAANLGKRIEQIGILLQGHHFWYLGEVYANPVARWALAGLLAAVTLLGLEVYLAFEAPKPGQEDLPAPAWLQRISASAPLLWRRVLGLTLLAGLIVVQSCFTVSDLFITHFALLLPLLPLLGAAAADLLAQHGRRPALLAFAALLVWGGFDAWNTVRYHAVLTASGGYAAHSDASYRLTADLEARGMTAPIVLDWGIEAPVAFLAQGRVAPVEAFGYARLDQPDADFATRLAPFIADASTVYLLHTPEFTVFQGRREALQALAAGQGRRLEALALFRERSGRPLLELVRLVPAP
ncbi:glycosyltransferase family 39 protein [Candidatus Amarolinea dominans]|uniref:ArnT family glycosyltransferase n=1 Tax=Candidatus Amarolinea dominans TaxID=3140696 RepID=UPI00313750DD|nr:glycosyltransferase family 39 protein [Anaerolineae bacterium]